VNTQLRHFCTHALGDLIDYNNAIAGHGAYKTYSLEAIRWLRQAVKFSYDGADAETVPEEVAREWLVDDPKLPFEFVAIEMVGDYDNGHASPMENVYLCANLNVISKEVYEPIQEDLDLIDDSEGFLIWPINKIKAGGDHWFPAPVMAIILPREEMDRWESMSHNSQKHRMRGEAGDPFLMIQHLVDWELTCESVEAQVNGLQGKGPFWMHSTITKLMEDFGSVLVGDCKTVASMFTLLECSNVVYRTHLAPGKLNLKRRKKKRQPFFEYRTLVIDPNKPREVGPYLGTHGLRRPPKLHLRRGHIRHLRSGNKTWVSPAMIGSKRRGMVLKDYEITTEEKSE
jgi:hypothetical protein